MKTVLGAAAIAVAALSAPMSVTAPKNASADNPSWTRPVKPFRVVGPVYYVGTEGIGVYLIASGHRAVLLDSGPEAAAPLVERNIRALGFKLKDVKIIISSHAHFDHVGGLARIRHDTGAPYYASAGDRWALEHGEHDSDTDYPRGHFPPVHVDHELRDGEVVALGGVRLKATLTPGHTKGCTTWSTRVITAGRVLDVVFPCSVTVAGNVLAGNKAYPGIADDYRRSFATLDAMKADIVLSNHPEFADVLGREKRLLAGDADAFIDPGQLHHIVADARQAFDADLAKRADPSAAK